MAIRSHADTLALIKKLRPDLSTEQIEKGLVIYNKDKSRTISITELNNDKTLKQASYYAYFLGKKRNDDWEYLRSSISKHVGKGFASKLQPVPIKIDYKESRITYPYMSISGINKPYTCMVDEVCEGLFSLYDNINSMRKKKVPEASIRKSIIRTNSAATGAYVRSLLEANGAPIIDLEKNIKNIVEDLKPFELLEATTIESYAEMYGSGPGSCMSASKHEWPHLSALGLLPVSFYAFFPDVFKGFYMKAKNGRIAARTIGTKSPGGQWHYYRIYSDSSLLTDKFMKALHAAGVKLNGAGFSIPKGVYRVPAKLLAAKDRNNTFYMPYPYMDGINMGRDHTPAYYLDGDDIAICINGAEPPKGGEKLTLNGGTNMYVMTSNKNKIKCTYCKTSFDGKGSCITYGSNVFCSNTHAMSFAAHNRLTPMWMNDRDASLVDTQAAKNGGYIYDPDTNFFFNSMPLAERMGYRSFCFQEDGPIVAKVPLDNTYPVKDKLKRVSTFTLPEAENGMCDEVRVQLQA